MRMSTVEVTNLSHSYGGQTALNGTAFSLESGITGLLGPNGAGKTTLLKCLATVLRPDMGEIRILGLDPNSQFDLRGIRRSIGYMPQESGFYEGFTAFEFIDYLAILKEIPDAAVRTSEAMRVLKATNLEARATTKIRKLSGGMRRRLLLAQALIGEPPVVILDEPTVGLDPEQRLRFREHISDLVSGERTVILSTHQTEDVAALCDRVVVLDEGTVRFQGSPADLADLAKGLVWASDSKPTSARITWRMPDGRFRVLGGAPPSDAPLLEPTIEDGYLTLIDPLRLAEVE